MVRKFFWLQESFKIEHFEKYGSDLHSLVHLLVLDSIYMQKHIFCKSGPLLRTSREAQRIFFWEFRLDFLKTKLHDSYFMEKFILDVQKRKKTTEFENGFFSTQLPTGGTQV